MDAEYIKGIWKTGFDMKNLYRKNEAENNGYVLWILITVELLMSFSFLGYIHIEPISITFVYIPVLIAGCMLGPKESTIVGSRVWPFIHVESVRVLCWSRRCSVFSVYERKAG